MVAAGAPATVAALDGTGGSNRTQAADPVPRLPQRGVRQAHQHQSRQAVLDIGLDLHRVTLHTDHRDGMGARHRDLSHPPHMLDLVATGRITHQPDHVDAHLVEEHAVRDQPADGQPPQPRLLAPADRVQR